MARDERITVHANHLFVFRYSADAFGGASRDRFIEAMLAISREAKEDPELLKEAPHSSYVRRLDETSAARNPILRWNREQPKGDDR